MSMLIKYFYFNRCYYRKSCLFVKWCSSDVMPYIFCHIYLFTSHLAWKYFLNQMLNTLFIALVKQRNILFFFFEVIPFFSI
jgi:hypothetical protein